MTIPLIPEYTGDPALRSDGPVVFPVNAEAQYTYLALIATDWNVTINAMNTVIGETSGYAASASDSATSASNSASSAAVSADESASSALISESNANFKGKWENSTGAVNIPASYWHSGSNWQLLVNVADITATEPSADNDDYSVIITPALSEPDVKISFNDGITMERGYGTVDSNGNTAIDFTRASASGNINKSGVSVDLEVDEAGITSDGMSVYGEVTNKLLRSEDFSNGLWVKSRATVVSDAIDSPMIGVLADALEVSGTDSYSRVRQLVTTAQNSTFSFFAKAGTSSSASIRVEGSLNASVNIDLTAEWQLFSVSGELFTSVSIFPHHGAVTGSGAIGDNIYIWGSQVNELSTPAPYIKTESVPVTRAPDIASIPMMNNMPAAGMPFTIMCDCALPINGSPIHAWGSVPSSSAAFFLGREPGGLVRFFYNDADGVDRAAIVDGVDDGVHRFACVYDESAVISIYIDGVLSGNAFGGLDKPSLYSLSMGIGKWTKYLNSEIKNFEIFHKALSSEEIAARGGPK